MCVFMTDKKAQSITKNAIVIPRKKYKKNERRGLHCGVLDYHRKESTQTSKIIFFSHF